MAGRSPARPQAARSGRSPLTRRRRGAAPRAGTLQGLAEDGVQIGGGAAAADEVRGKPPGGRLGLRPGTYPQLGPAEE